MNRLRNSLLGGLASTLFGLSVACNGAVTPALVSSPTPIVAESTKPIANYKPNTKVASAINFLSQRSDRNSAESYVVQTYGQDGTRAVNLMRLADSKKDDIISRVVSGSPYSPFELEGRLGTNNPYELNPLLDYIFDDVYIFNVEENEMVEFRKSIDSYREFKDATNFGTKERPDIDPNLKSLLAYTVIFTIRSLHQDPLVAHKYAYAIANDKKTSEGVYEITYDIYFVGKSGVEKVVAKVEQAKNENPRQKAQEKISDKIQEARKTISEESEKLKRTGDEVKRKAEDEARRKQEEFQRKQEQARKEAEEAKKKLEEETRRKLEDARRIAEEQKKKLEENAQKAKRDACEKAPEFLKKQLCN